MTLSDMTNGTSALVSEDGPSPSCEPVTQSSVEYFQSLRHANLTARQAKEWDLLTSGTYGPRATTTSDISALESLLASRYQASLPSNGGGLYRTTFKRRDTGLSRSIPAWRASAARTSDNDYTGWPTPTSRDWRSDRHTRTNQELYGTKGIPLPAASYLSGWPTPRAGTGEDNLPVFLERQARCKIRHPDKGMGVPLGPTAQMVGPIRYTVHGEMLTGCSAQMASGGQLNPALPRWLMAFPAEWERSAPGYDHWSIWQALMQAIFDMQSDTASEA